MHRLVPLTVVMSIAWVLPGPVLAGEANTAAALVQAMRDEVEPDYRRHGTLPERPAAVTASPGSAAPRDFDRREVIATLARRQHRDPQLDGYLRRHLLEALPADALSELSRAESLRLIAALPTIRRLPGPATAPMRPTLSVVNEGGVLDVQGHVSHDRRYVTLNVQTSQADVVRLRQVAEAMAVERPVTMPGNDDAMAFRKALIDRLPEQQGLRLVGRMRDLRDRLAAGEPSASAVAAQMNDALAAQDDLPEGVRRTLRGQAERLVGVERQVFDAAAGEAVDVEAAAVRTVTVEQAVLRSMLERLGHEDVDSLFAGTR